MNKVNAKWAAKLLRTKNFVVLTDDESAIFIDNNEPKGFDTYMTLAAQSSAIDHFIKSLKRVKSEHDKTLRAFAGANTVKKTSSSKTDKQAKKTAPRTPSKKQATKKS